MGSNIFETLFYFMNEEVCVLEIKISGMSEDAPKDKRYHWLKLTKKNNQVDKLVFQSMNVEDVNGNKINVRAFKNAELRFDDHFGKFLHNDIGHIIMNSPIDSVPSDLIKTIENYIEVKNLL